MIKTFGLGKARIDVIAEICERNGWRFEKSFGEKRWLEYDELYRWLRDCDAIVLWYDGGPDLRGQRCRAARDLDPAAGVRQRHRVVSRPPRSDWDTTQVG